MDISKVVFFCDMDGTLLTADKRLTERNSDAILRFRRAGGIFVAATGRVLQAVRHFFDPLGLDCPAIFCNGGMVYDCGQNKVMWAEYLQFSKAAVMIDTLLREFPKASAEICMPDCIYAVNVNDEERRHQQIGHFDALEVPSLEEIPDGNVSKVLFAMNNAYIKPFAEYADTIGNICGAEFVSSSRIYYEMLPRNCTKGFAMQKLLDIYGLKGHYTVAMGDYSNDRAMLMQADFSACPNNAIDEVKAVCSRVCDADNDSDAVAEIIDTLLSS